MGGRAETVAAGDSGNNHTRPFEAHDVGVSSQEDRGCPEGAMGEDQGAGKQGGIVDFEIISGLARIFPDQTFSVHPSI
jgi:hypothetical protein